VSPFAARRAIRRTELETVWLSAALMKVPSGKPLASARQPRLVKSIAIGDVEPRGLRSRGCGSVRHDEARIEAVTASAVGPEIINVNSRSEPRRSRCW